MALYRRHSINKTRDIAKHFHYVHSVSNLKVIQRLNAQRDETLGPLNIFLQINVAGEVSKSGADRAEIEDLAAATLESPRLKLLGLMAIPPAGLTPEELGAYYKQLTELQSGLAQRFGQGFQKCSFGMSQDLEAAITQDPHGFVLAQLFLGHAPAQQKTSGST